MESDASFEYSRPLQLGKWIGKRSQSKIMVDPIEAWKAGNAVEVESFSRQPWLATVGIHALKKYL